MFINSLYKNAFSHPPYWIVGSGFGITYLQKEIASVTPLQYMTGQTGHHEFPIVSAKNEID